MTGSRAARALTTPVRAALAVSIALGIALGLGAFTFVYARGYSYLSNDPAVCANCHIMQEHFDAWRKSTHRAVAACNDCHTPHAFVGKYATKARNGFWHSFYFTTGRYPDPLRITPGNRRIALRSCRDCHAELTGAIDPRTDSRGSSGAPVHTASTRADEPLDCVRCHRYVGHDVR